MFETGITVGFEFKFEFGRFLPVTGPTGPVNRNRWPAVRSRRSVKKSMAAVLLVAEVRYSSGEDFWPPAAGAPDTCAGYVYAQDGVKIREPVVQLPYSRCTS